MKQTRDKGQGNDKLGVVKLKSIFDKAIEKVEWFIDKAVFPENVREKAEAFLKAGGDMKEAIKLFGGQYLGISAFPGNLLLNEGINALWTLVAGGSETAFNNANARLGVGDSSAAEAATQTDLQAAVNKLYKAMDATYPTYGTSQKITFRSTFAGADANWAWNEFTADNGGTALKNLNRKVSAQGTKTSGQSWQLTLEITLS